MAAANTFTGMPFIIQTSMTTTYKNTTGTGAPVNNLSIYPLVIEYFNPQTAGNTVSIVDANGNLLFNCEAETTTQSQYFKIADQTRWQDFKVTMTNSSTTNDQVYIWYKT